MFCMTIYRIKLFCILLVLSCLELYPQKTTVKLTISQVFELAEQNAHLLKHSRIEIDRQKAAISFAKKDRLPNIEASANGSFIGNQNLLSRDFSTGTIIHTPHWGNNASLEITQSIYQGGYISSNISLKELQAELASIQHSTNRQELRYALCSWYLSLCKLDNELKVYLENKVQSKKLLSEIQARYEAGTALRSDITRYNLRLKDIEMKIERTENQLSIINYHLATVLGLDEGTAIQTDSDFLKNYTPEFSEQEWQQQTINNSPSILSASKQEDIWREQKNTVKSELRPTIFLWGRENLKGPITTAMPPINKNINAWELGIGVKFNISSLYKTNKKLSMYNHSIMQAKENTILQEENERMAVNMAYTNLKESINQLSIQKKYKELASENYEIVSQRYLNGLAIITEMLDASNEQLASDLKVVNTQVEIYTNYYQLKKLSGSL